MLRSTGRKGVDAVLDYLDCVGFYTAPSSIDRHHNWRGGLAQHSLETCRLALAGRGGVSRESVIIAALLHDICKASRLYYGADGRIHHRSTRIKGHGYCWHVRGWSLPVTSGLPYAGTWGRARPHPTWQGRCATQGSAGSSMTATSSMPGAGIELLGGIKGNRQVSSRTIKN